MQYIKFKDAPDVMKETNVMQALFYAVASKIAFLATRSMKIHNVRPSDYTAFFMASQEPPAVPKQEGGGGEGASRADTPTKKVNGTRHRRKNRL
jgi:hypothetical protein